MAVEAPFELVDEGLSARLDTRRPAIVRGYITAIDAVAADAAIERARADLGHLQAFALRPIGELQTRLVHEEDWAEAWKEHFPVLRVGRRIVIRPTWREYSTADGDVVISLDPGMAFGTGLHPTTRLCLAAIEDLAAGGKLGGATAIDVGCGSGILAICGALLGARQVLAIDTDPLAVEVSRRNADLNGVSDVIAVRHGSLPLAEPPAEFDVVFANLVAGLLVDLAADLADVVARDGILLASGIFRDREPDVVSAFESCGLRVVARQAEGDWVGLQATRS